MDAPIATADSRGTTTPRSATVCAQNLMLAKRIGEALASAGHRVDRRFEGLDELGAAAAEVATDIAVVGAARVGIRVATGLRRVFECLGDTSLVVVCDQASTGDIRRALETGVDGVVLTAELEKALGAVSAAVSAGRSACPAERRGGVREPVLTTREKDTLGLIVMGLGDAQIACKLFLAESTVKSHLSSAFAKLSVSSRNEAVALILDPDRGRRLGIHSVPNECLDGGAPEFGRPSANNPTDRIERRALRRRLSTPFWGPARADRRRSGGDLTRNRPNFRPPHRRSGAGLPLVRRMPAWRLRRFG